MNCEDGVHALVSLTNEKWVVHDRGIKDLRISEIAPALLVALAQTEA